MRDITRRQALALAALGSGAFAGCSSSGGPTATTTETVTTTPTESDTVVEAEPPSESETPTESETPSRPSLTQLATLGEGIDDGGFFGGSVALSADGSTALVGARNAVQDGKETGAAYVFERSGGGWKRRATLVADDAAAEDWFGRAVTLSGGGSIALVGAPMKRTAGGDEAGVGYAFAEDGGEWRQTARITASDGDAIDHFAENVDLADDGGTALIGAPGDDSESLGAIGSKGSVYAFDDEWRQQAKISFTEPEDSPNLGSAVSISADGSVALVGAEYDEGPDGGYLGSAFVFEQGATGWERTAKLSLDGLEHGDRFGDAVALSGDGTAALVGASYHDTTRGQNAGSITFFEETEDGWERTDTRSPAPIEAGDRFGGAVSLSHDGTAAVVGIGGEDTGDPYDYTLEDGNWMRRSELEPEPGEPTDFLGLGVDLAADGTTALVGSPGSDVGYLFTR